MKASERIFLRELNSLSEKVFKLYSQGEYQEAQQEAETILKKAIDNLGRNHQYTKIYQENLEFVRSGQMKRFHKKKQYKVAIPETKKGIAVTNEAFGLEQSNISAFQDNLINIEETSKAKRLLKRTLFTLSALMISIALIGSLFPVYELYTDFLSKLSLPSLKINSSEKKPVFASGLLGNYSYDLRENVLINTPLIRQYPELPRGCEVASLAMLLNYAGVNVDKLKLAKDVKKDPSKYEVIDGRTYFGNPDYGFVGDMYSLDNPGFGVYNGPIYDLLENYLPGQSINLTGRKFRDLFYFLNKEIPVWVIINTKFAELRQSEFVVWYTSYGPIQATYRQHAVLLTGYDSKYVYFNDPLAWEQNSRIEIDQFERAWFQMGSQAVSFITDDMKLLEILPLD